MSVHLRVLDQCFLGVPSGILLPSGKGPLVRLPYRRGITIVSVRLERNSACFKISALDTRWMDRPSAVVFDAAAASAAACFAAIHFLFGLLRRWVTFQRALWRGQWVER
jgi:hypothetical protein